MTERRAQQGKQRLVSCTPIYSFVLLTSSVLCLLRHQTFRRRCLRRCCSLSPQLSVSLVSARAGSDAWMPTSKATEWARNGALKMGHQVCKLYPLESLRSTRARSFEKCAGKCYGHQPCWPRIEHPLLCGNGMPNVLHPFTIASGMARNVRDVSSSARSCELRASIGRTTPSRRPRRGRGECQ